LIQQLYFDEQARLDDWEALIADLLSQGLIELDQETVTLTEEGKIAGQLARGERIGRMFSDTLSRYQSSEAHSKFCRRVFGIDLNQADLMDKFQLEKLLKVLNLSKKNRVLDLACGIGRIAEYISDTTGAYVLGIDVAADALELARQRTQEKRHRLDFQIGNMDHLNLPDESFDTVIAVAAIHYAHDIENTIGQLKHILTPDGQMAVFSFQYQGEDDPPEILLPENTEMGKALRAHGFSYQTWDFTEREISVRRKQIKAAAELMEEFTAEGNRVLAQDRIEECELDLPRLLAGMKRRYLYHAHAGQITDAS
jgi:ubiquinone/menaquinone biosynthesis C-methylase UbiE